MSNEPTEKNPLEEWMEQRLKKKDSLASTREGEETTERKFSLDEVKEFIEDYSQVSRNRGKEEAQLILPEGYEVSAIIYDDEGVSEVVASPIDKGLRFVLMGAAVGFVAGLVVLLTLIRLYPGLLFLF